MIVPLIGLPNPEIRPSGGVAGEVDVGRRGMLARSGSQAPTPEGTTTHRSNLPLPPHYRTPLMLLLLTVVI